LYTCEKSWLIDRKAEKILRRGDEPVDRCNPQPFFTKESEKKNPGCDLESMLGIRDTVFLYGMTSWTHPALSHHGP
jgi:hypothetical protein